MKLALLKSSLAVVAPLAVLLFHAQSLRAQGSLVPPGAPAPSMKSLSQIEARTPVDATNTPGNSTAQFNITQAGSYYLTGNITGVNSKHGIVIQTNDVTLDLNGFEMTGISGSYDGIGVIPGAQNITIHNGTLRSWGIGVIAPGGNCELEHLRIYACTSQGIDVGSSCTVRSCTTVSNGNIGISFGNGGIVTACLASSNSAAGISGGSDCVMNECLAIANNGDGIDLSNNFNIRQCTSDHNGGNGFTLGSAGSISGCVANTNSDSGVEVDNTCTISECRANGNFISGFTSVGSEAVVVDNQASFNTGFGIETFGSYNRIDGNYVVGNDVGIYSMAGPNVDVVVRNTSSGNGDNYSPSSGTTFAPVQTPSTATNSWANF